MIKEYIEGFNNPLPYIFIVFILSAFSYEIYNSNKLLAVFIVSGFLACLFIFKGIYITIILTLFLIVGFANNIWFYNFNIREVEEIRITDIRNCYGSGEINGRLVNLSNVNSEIKIGDRIIARGDFTENKNIIKGYIGDYRINDYKLMKDDLISKLYKKREYIFNKIEDKIGNRKAALITSVAFGYKSELDNDDRDVMSSLGVSHVISVSGLHLVLIYNIVSKVLGIKLGLLIAFIYVLFTGSLSPGIRAYIMIFIMNLGKIVYRNYNPLAALSLSGIIILILKPYEVFGLGFILSFLATLGIILYNKDLNKKLYKLPNSIRGTIAVSLSAQVFTLPVLILYFNETSIKFLIGNILVVPFMTALLVLGNILIFIEGIPELFNYCLYLCNIIIKIIDIIINKIDSFGTSILYFHYTVAYFYISLLTTYYFYKRGFKRFIYYPLVMTVYIFILIYSPIPKIRYYKEGGLLISYKGDRVLIQTKDTVNEEKLKRISSSNNIISFKNNIRLSEDITIKKEGENYILYTKNNEYLLFVNYEKINSECDIIDFRKGDIGEIMVFNGEIITR